VINDCLGGCDRNGTPWKSSRVQVLTQIDRAMQLAECDLERCQLSRLRRAWSNLVQSPALSSCVANASVTSGHQFVTINASRPAAQVIDLADARKTRVRESK
jgi:hypothetical protein